MSQSDAPEIQQILRLVDRPLWIITARGQGGASGLVANSVMPIAADPEQPLLGVALSPDHFTAQLIDESGTFVAHLLKPTQAELVWRFGLASGRDADKFVDLQTTPSSGGAPVLVNCLAWLECYVLGRFSAGDRTIYWSQIIGGRHIEGSQPLLESQAIQAAAPETLARLRTLLKDDLRRQRELRQQWLASLPGGK